MRLPLVLTKFGLPAVWESGGGRTNTGRARVVCGPKGERLRPVYVRRRGVLACSDHALFVVRPGVVVVEADHHRGDFRIRVSRITSIQGDSATTELVAEFSEGEWQPALPSEFEAAVEAAKAKALCYHCREPYYIREEQAG